MNDPPNSTAVMTSFRYFSLNRFSAKAVIDQRWATVGSTNLDPLSLLLAREANVMTTDRRFSALLHRWLADVVEREGQQLDAQVLGQRPWHQRLLDRLAFGVMRATLFLTGHRY